MWMEDGRVGPGGKGVNRSRRNSRNTPSPKPSGGKIKADRPRSGGAAKSGKRTGAGGKEDGAKAVANRRDVRRPSHQNMKPTPPAGHARTPSIVPKKG